VLGEAGLAARDARPRPRQPEARRRHRAGGQPGGRTGEPVPWPTSIEAVPCRVRMRLHTLPGWHSRSPPLAPMTRAGRSTAASLGVPKWSGGYDAVRQPEPQDRRAAPQGADLRRPGACRAMIGCALAGGAGGGLRPAASGPAAGAQAGFLAVLRLIIRRARWALTLRSMTHAGRHVT
jgi:hypothetical protein